MIEAVVVDLGGVAARFCPERRLAALASRSGVADHVPSNLTGAPDRSRSVRRSAVIVCTREPDPTWAQRRSLRAFRRTMGCDTSTNARKLASGERAYGRPEGVL